MDILMYTCECCKRKTEVIATVFADNGDTQDICPVCLQEVKAGNARQVKAGPSEVKNGA